MKIGVPKEIKNKENRVGLVPSGVIQLTQDGHEVFIETRAGQGIGISDEDYIQAGAHILPSIEAVYEKAEMIVKVKEPQPSEVSLIKPHHLIFTYLHLAADKDLTVSFMNSQATYYAYETIQAPNGSLPLLVPMSEVAGRMATQIGAHFLQNDNGGKGLLLGGVPGVRRGRVVVIGCGVSGTNATKMAMGMGASVQAIDISAEKLASMDDLFENRLTTLYSNPKNIADAVARADLVIGAVLLPGGKAPKLVTKEMIASMEPGSVIVDIAVDQGGCIETCRPTSHQNPTYEVDGVLHYCVPNIPGAVAQTSTYALTNVTLGFIRKLAAFGPQEVLTKEPMMKGGLNIYRGDLVYEKIADDLHLPYTNLSI